MSPVVLAALLHSLTKSFCMAGVRLGYAVAPAPVIRVLERAAPPWQVGVHAQAAAWALSDSGEVFLQRTVTKLFGLQDSFSDLHRLGLNVVQTHTNFLLEVAHAAGFRLQFCLAAARAARHPAGSRKRAIGGVVERVVKGGLELWLIRHGETDWNRARRIQGQSQNPLSPLGIKQSRRLGVRLMAETFDRVYSSDLARASHTAEIALPGVPVMQDARLREISRGVLEGKTQDEMTPAELALYQSLRADFRHNRPPGGENFLDVEARLQHWLKALPEVGRVAAFTHGGVIHALLHLLIGPPGTWRFAINNTSITRLSVQKEWTTIEMVNDHAHVLGRENLWSY